MDINDIDLALHEIEQMVLVAINADEGCVGSDTASGFFQLPAQDAELLCFSLFDIQKRVRALREELNPPERAKAPVLTLIPGGAS